jgi:hypothetical protein
MVEPDVSTYLQAPSVGQVLQFNIKRTFFFTAFYPSSLLYSFTDLSCCARDICVISYMFAYARTCARSWDVMDYNDVRCNDDVMRWLYRLPLISDSRKIAFEEASSSFR